MSRPLSSRPPGIPGTSPPPLLPALLLALLLAACGGGGGGVDVDPPDPGGGSGTGAGGIPIFAWKYGPEDFGQASSVVETGDNAFVFAGFRKPDAGAVALYLVKADAKGKVLWERTLHGPPGYVSAIGWSVCAAPGGGFLAAGSAATASAPGAFLLVRTDGDGNELWSRCYTGRDMDGDGFRAVTATADNGFVAAGAVAGLMVDVYLLKTDWRGNVLWETVWGEQGPDRAGGLAGTSDGGFAVAGEYDGGGANLTGLLLKADGGGSVSWWKRYDNARFNALVQAPDNGFVLVGRTKDMAGRTDLLVVRTDAAGNETLRRVFGGARDEEGFAVARARDGGYVVAGFTGSYSDGTDPVNFPWQTSDVYLLRLKANLDTEWQVVKGRAPDSGDGGNAVAATTDGGYLVGGALGGSALLAKFDRDGNTVRLGDTDFTYRPTEGPGGVVTMTNSADVAGAGVTALDMVRSIGPMAVDLLAGILAGDTPSDFCTGGGTYAHILTPGPVAAGSVLTVSFDNCVSGAGADNVLFNGAMTVTVDNLAGTVDRAPFAGGGYLLGARVAASSFTFADDVGEKGLSGTLRFTRQAGTFPSTVDNSWSEGGDSLALSWGGTTLGIAPFAVGSSWSPGLYVLGPADATVERSGIGTLRATVGSYGPAGPAQREPERGIVLVTADDGTAVRLTLAAGGAAYLEVDTNGDGTYEGVRWSSWDRLLY